ncbi:hypothetical protein Purlil1_8694 [Purpureocillium lilacinum]|uniref:Uncharacterized protein n=1 Tax=Purpureocillium lilacinum TaxID=33203 RepID=A0ABR0BSH8_PURLI|nr:hypothetical protein Purlil1_8694 [Purpureocillium lilacinum]
MSQSHKVCRCVRAVNRLHLQAAVDGTSVSHPIATRRPHATALTFRGAPSPHINAELSLQTTQLIQTDSRLSQHSTQSKAGSPHLRNSQAARRLAPPPSSAMTTMRASSTPDIGINTLRSSSVRYFFFVRTTATPPQPARPPPTRHAIVASSRTPRFDRFAAWRLTDPRSTPHQGTHPVSAGPHPALLFGVAARGSGSLIDRLPAWKRQGAIPTPTWRGDTSHQCNLSINRSIRPPGPPPLSPLRIYPRRGASKAKKSPRRVETRPACAYRTGVCMVGNQSPYTRMRRQPTLLLRAAGIIANVVSRPSSQHQATELEYLSKTGTGTGTGTVESLLACTTGL